MRGTAYMRNNLPPYKIKPRDESSWLLPMPCLTRTALDMERSLLVYMNFLRANIWKNSFLSDTFCVEHAICQLM